LPDGRDRVLGHGHGPQRAIQTGVGPVEIRRAKVRDRADVAAEEKIRFTSSIPPKWARRTNSLDPLLPFLYLRGAPTGDFHEVWAHCWERTRPTFEAGKRPKLGRASSAPPLQLLARTRAHRQRPPWDRGCGCLRRRRSSRAWVRRPVRPEPAITRAPINSGGSRVAAPCPLLIRSLPFWGTAAELWRQHFANRCCYPVGARLVDVLKGVERRVRQGRFGSGNSAKLYHTFFVGDRGHCINYFL
jgi:hypothetical protein